MPSEEPVMQMTAMAAIFSLQILLTTRRLMVRLQQRGAPSRRTQVNDADEGGCGQLLPALIGGRVPHAVRRVPSRLGWLRTWFAGQFPELRVEIKRESVRAISSSPTH